MNLLGRNCCLGGLLAVFLFSCEEPNEIGLSLNPEDEVGVYYVELPVQASMVNVDSVATSASSLILSGVQSDDVFGATQAIGYTQVGFNASALNTAAVLDSVVLTLAPASFHGPDETEIQKFSVHRLSEYTLTPDSSIYYSSQFMAYDAQALGEANLRYETEDDTATTQREDLLSITLSQQFGEELFDELQADAFDSTVAFYKYLKGFAVVGDVNNQAVVGFDLGSDDAKLTLHYHTNDEDSLVFNLKLANSVPHYSYIKADRSSGIIPVAELYEPFAANGLIYGQAGTGLVPRLKFEAYQNFVDTVGDFVLNSATIDLGQVSAAAEGLNPPNTLYMYLTDETNFRKVFSSSQGLYFGSINFGYQNTAPLDFNYNAHNQTYFANASGNPAVYFTMLKEDLIEFDEVLIYSSLNNASVNQFIIDPENIKLKLYYTKLKN